MWGTIFMLGFLGLEGFLIYDGLMALAAAVPEVLAVLVGLYIMAVWAVQDVWKWATRKRQRVDEDGIPWLE